MKKKIIIGSILTIAISSLVLVLFLHQNSNSQSSLEEANQQAINAPVTINKDIQTNNEKSSEVLENENISNIKKENLQPEYSTRELSDEEFQKLVAEGKIKKENISKVKIMEEPKDDFTEEELEKYTLKLEKEKKKREKEIANRKSVILTDKPDFKKR